jgi:membrane protease YdiL (CAAX protease family)
METTDRSVKEISLPRLLVLIFLPAALTTMVYIIIGLLTQAVPSFLLFFLCALFILFPIETGVILNASKREYGRPSLKSAFSDHRKMGPLKVFLYGFALFAFSGIVFVAISPIEDCLFAPLSSRLARITPEYFKWDNVEYLKQYSKGTILSTCAVCFALNVIVGPVTEELFFRGYLTSGLSRFGDNAPLIVTVLFSLYHLWLPLENIFRIFTFFPAAFVAMKKKNIYISIAFHCLCNLFSIAGFIISVYRS